MEQLKDKINRLKKEKNAIILAHYYQPLEVQMIADIVGDSLELARKSKNTDAEVLVFCGVTFMGESAALLCPQKRVLLPAPDAGCDMADTITPEDVLVLKSKHPNSTVICYINSTAETKAVCDICCTSSNAVKVARSVKTKDIIFVPDKNLGRYVAGFVEDKEFHYHDKGCCPIHDKLSLDALNKCTEQHPNAKILVHPECSKEICDRADFVGSTSQIIDYCSSGDAKKYIICTELGVTERMQAMMPDKTFYAPDVKQLYCKSMKAVTLEMIADTLENMSGEVFVDSDLREAALRPIERMLAL